MEKNGRRQKIENPFWRFRDGQLEFLGSGWKRVVSFRFDLIFNVLRISFGTQETQEARHSMSVYKSDSLEEKQTFKGTFP